MDSEHFKRIFLPYYKKLYRLAYRLLENQADAGDMVQETYVKLWQERLELESLINPESFAVTLLKNGCLDFPRKVKPGGSPCRRSRWPGRNPRPGKWKAGNNRGTSG